MKKCMAVLLLLAFMLQGCGRKTSALYQYTDYTLFDTVTTIMGYADSREEFEKTAKEICSELETYHRLLNIYEDYEGIHNLKTVNDRAGMEAVTVEKPILDLLEDCKGYYKLSEGRVNVCMGSVLELWHQARAQAIEGQAQIPGENIRRDAAKHCRIDDLILDREKSTVFLRDPHMRLDVGAVAKGWAAQQASIHAPQGMLISVGGNVCVTGPKPDGSAWKVGIQNPDGEGYLRTVELTKGSLVTSGDYQRYFEVDGKRYHHIIDPDTTLPGNRYHSVTVFCEDSGLADVLSTALFLMNREDGNKLLESTGAEAFFLDSRGNLYGSPGFPQ